MVSIDTGHVPHGGTMDAEGNTLNPAGADEKTWGSFAIFNIWANDVQSRTASPAAEQVGV